LTPLAAHEQSERSIHYGPSKVVYIEENDKSKDNDYSWSGSNKYFRLYGIKNNDDIEKVEFTLEEGYIFSTTTFYDDLFLIIFKTPINNRFVIKNIKGYDKDNRVIYEFNQ
jgi:hypothetical protein